MTTLYHHISFDDDDAPRRVLFPDLSDDEVGMALLAEEWDPARDA